MKKFIDESSEGLIEEFISIIKKIYNLEKFEKIIDQSFSTIKKEAENIKRSHENKEDLSEILASSKYIDVYFFNIIIEIFKKQNISDCLTFLSQDENQKHFEQFILFDEKNLSFFNKEKKISDMKKNISQITNIIKLLNVHDFNKNDYSIETKRKIQQNLINKIAKDKNVIEFLKFLVSLTAFDEKFIQFGSNSYHLLVNMKVDLRKHSFKNIRLKNTCIIGALLFNCKWKYQKIRELNKLNGHNGYIRSICFSPDGTTLASGSLDKSIRFWDVKTGQQKAKLDGHSDWVSSVCFSVDGNTLATGSADYSICLWDVQKGQQKSQLHGHKNWVYQVCFSPDGTTIASCSRDKFIRLWDVNTEEQKAKFDGHNREVQSVCFSPDGNTLASGGYDNSIRLWDIKKRQQTKKFIGHSGWVLSVCFSPDGTTLASGSYDNTIILWNVKTRQQKAQLIGHDNFINTVCFSPDGAILLSGSWDQSIRLWDVDTGEQKKEFIRDGINCWSVCISPDGTTIASGNKDNSISLWGVKMEN